MNDNQAEQKENGFPAKIGRPATRALKGAGYTRLEELDEVSEAELKGLHGMGPKALGILLARLWKHGASHSLMRSNGQSRAGWLRCVTWRSILTGGCQGDLKATICR